MVPKYATSTTYSRISWGPRFDAVTDRPLNARGKRKEEAARSMNLSVASIHIFMVY